MKKYEIVKSSREFNDIIQTGQKNTNKYFLIFSKQSNDNLNRFGIAVGKKIGNAVVRNKWKRIIRVLVDHNKLLFKKYYNYIIMIKKECLGLTFKQLEKEFISLLRKEQNEE